jgi:polyhydroxyalkanoate synthesis regulator phasin
MANENNNGFIDTMMDAQKQMVNTVLENTKKLTNGANPITETIEKGSEWYKNWLENQKNVLGQTAEKATSATSSIQENASKMSDSYQNWMNTQANTAKQMWENTTNYMKTAAQPQAANPMEQMTNQWNNWMGQYNNWMNNMSTMNTWMNNMQQMQSLNPFNMNNFKSATETTNNFFTQWSELLHSNFAEFQNNLKSGTIQDAYKNMVNTTDGFTRFTEMMQPMWKSIQDKTFNMDQYKQYMNPALYKEFMDKLFSFMPENARTYMNQMTESIKNGFTQMGSMNMNGYQQMRQMMGSIPGMNAGDLFGGMLNAYNNIQHMMQSAVSPITRMITPNQYTKSAAEWQDLMNRYTVYSIKNAELQYMVYNQGTKVMDALAENITNKIQHGEEVKSMMALYQEWMSISDKTFVSLFESEDYSKLMAEVSALQMKLKKDTELQMEKMLVNVPVATRTEMDELYKTIYDLKKEVRQLEKMMEMDSEEEGNTAAPKAANGAAAPKPTGKK